MKPEKLYVGEVGMLEGRWYLVEGGKGRKIGTTVIV